MDSAISIFQSLLYFSVVMAVVVGFHEYGHFKSARLLGVKVLEFSIGMGKTVWQKTSKDGVTYKLCLLPIGGYVKMIDLEGLSKSELDSISDEDKSRSFTNAPNWKKFIIVACGPFFNLIMAVFLFSYLSFNYNFQLKSEIAYVTDNVPYAEGSVNKINSGDLITKVNGIKISSWNDVNLAFIGAVGSESVTIQLNDKKNTVLDFSDVKLDSKNTDIFKMIGFTGHAGTHTNKVSSLISDGASEKAGLQSGDIITSINGEATPTFYDIAVKMSKITNSNDIYIQYIRDGESLNLSFTPDLVGNPYDGYKGSLGIYAETTAIDKNNFYKFEPGVIESVVMGYERSMQIASLTLSTLGKLISGDISPTVMGGPVTIAKEAGNAASKGLPQFLSFIALFNINLMVLNLLPIPPLDGGHLAKNIIESVIRRPLNEKFEIYMQKFGVGMIIALMLVGFSADIIRIIF